MSGEMIANDGKAVALDPEEHLVRTGGSHLFNAVSQTEDGRSRREGRRRRFLRWLEEPVDRSSLVAFRIVFGGLMGLAIVRFFAHGWIAQMYQEPSFFFTYWGFEWVRPWPGVWMSVHFAVVGLAALGIASGVGYRWSAVVFFVGFTYIELLDKTNYLNHYYLLSLLGFLLVLTPLGRGEGATIPRLYLLLFRFQIGLVYIFAGIAKLKGHWLWEAQPLRIWLAARTEMPLLGRWFDLPETAYLLSYAGLLFDLTVVFFLLCSKTRLYAYLALIFFHLVTWKLFYIGLFPWIMIASALIFFPPSWPREAIRRFLGGQCPPSRRERDAAQLHHPPLVAPPLDPLTLGSASRKRKTRANRSGGLPGVQPLGGGGADLRSAASDVSTASVSEAGGVGGLTSEEGAASKSPLSRILLGVVGVYALVQVALPLRHHLYPGDVCWTEEGFRFSWKVMLMEKSGHVDFVAYDPISKRSFWISPKSFLKPQQVKMMQTQPDMILQAAHKVAADFRRQGYHQIQVRAEAWASLHGQPRERLIDPSVDLAQESESLRPKRWILPRRGRILEAPPPNLRKGRVAP